MLQAMVNSLEKKIDETEKRFEETNKLSEERLQQSLYAETKIIELKTAMQRFVSITKLWEYKLPRLNIQIHRLNEVPCFI